MDMKAVLRDPERLWTTKIFVEQMVFLVCRSEISEWLRKWYTVRMKTGTTMRWYSECQIVTQQSALKCRPPNRLFQRKHGQAYRQNALSLSLSLSLIPVFVCFFKYVNNNDKNNFATLSGEQELTYSYIGRLHLILLLICSLYVPES